MHAVLQETETTPKHRGSQSIVISSVSPNWQRLPCGVRTNGVVFLLCTQNERISSHCAECISAIIIGRIVRVSGDALKIEPRVERIGQTFRPFGRRGVGLSTLTVEEVQSAGRGRWNREDAEQSIMSDWAGDEAMAQ